MYETSATVPPTVVDATNVQPDADILQLNDLGITRTPWPDVDMIEHWRSFLDNPDLYLRHLFAD